MTDERDVRQCRRQARRSGGVGRVRDDQEGFFRGDDACPDEVVEANPFELGGLHQSEAGRDAEDRAPALSIVIPIYNEARNIVPLCEEISDVLMGLRHSFEIIFVDDGSSDASGEVLAGLASKEGAIRVVTLRRNFGQTAAMMAGIDCASGNIIIPMDGDRQNDPADIPALLDKLAEGYDVVSGWRKDRKDKRFTRVFVSRVANWMISKLSGVVLHDYGCSLKAYRADSIKSVRLYGEMHRFIPIYASWQGARVGEIPVHHRPRIEGASNYGLDRIVKVILDLMVVLFLGRYETKPIYVFGGFGLVSFAIAGASGVYATYLKLAGIDTYIETPLPLICVMATLCGCLSILMGFLAELLVRTYYESQNKTPYRVRDILNARGN
jgi:glycosyltransferase involved in cell wall biosynthesis